MFNIFWIHIRNWNHVWYKFFLEILNVSGSIGYLFRFGFGSDNTHNPKYHKTKSIRFLCRVWIGSDSFLSGRVRFGFLDSVYLPSPIPNIGRKATHTGKLKPQTKEIKNKKNHNHTEMDKTKEYSDSNTN